MAESWVRLWAGMTINAKWQTIARKSGQRRSLVIAMFTHLLMVANEADPRGSVAAADIEDVASVLDEDEAAIRAIWDALLGRAIDPETLHLTGWEKHQPVREDLGNPATGAKSPAERKREQRARDKAATYSEESRDVTASHGESRDVTASHGESRDVTASHAPEAEADTEAEETQQPPATARDGSFAMDLSWEPSAHFPTLARQAGVTAGLPTESLAEFRSYWLSQPDTLRTQHEWDHALLRSLKAEKLRGDQKPRNGGGARASPASAADRLTEHNRAAMAEAKAAILAREKQHASG